MNDGNGAILDSASAVEPGFVSSTYHRLMLLSLLLKSKIATIARHLDH
jgi:hypothetical protein